MSLEYGNDNYNKNSSNKNNTNFISNRSMPKRPIRPWEEMIIERLWTNEKFLHSDVRQHKSNTNVKCSFNWFEECIPSRGVMVTMIIFECN